MLWGIDVSHYQGTFNFARARAEGFDFAFLKATEGSTYRDPQFTSNLASARAAGLLTAAYHYQKQGTAVGDRIRNIAGIVPRDCPVIIDLEDTGGHTDQTRETINALHQNGYASPLLYLPRWYWQQIGSPDLSGLPPLWSSRYPDTRGGTASAIYQRVPSSYWAGYGGASVAVLQFTSSAAVAGTTPVDCNVYGGTRDQLAALLGGASTFAAAPGGIEDMALDTQWTDSYNNVQTIQSWMADLQRKINDLWFPAVSPGSVSSRIPGDTNTTTIYDMVADSTSWTNQTLGRVIALQAAGATDPNAVAEALRPVVADVIGPIVAQSVAAALGTDNQTQADAIVAEISRRLAEGDTIHG